MNIQDLTEMVRNYMFKFFKEKFSGRIVLTFHFNQGGVGGVDVEIKQDLKKWYKQVKGVAL